MPPSRRLLPLLLEIIVNFVLPYLVYDETKARLGDVHALLLSSIPPLLWSAVELIRKRRLDGMSMLVLAGIVLSLLAFAGGGSVRMLQLREQLVTGVIGCIFLGSVAIGRPLLREVALAGMRRHEPEKAAQMQHNAAFLHSVRVMTLVWGCGLIASAALAAILVFHMPVQRFLIVGPIVGYGIMGLLAGWNFLYVKYLQRRGKASKPMTAVQGS